MIQRILRLLLAVLLAAPALRAQVSERDEPSLPRDVARAVVELYNAPTTTRVVGPLTVDSGRTITGDVASLGGPVTVAGHITGRLLAINADVTFQRGARVDGDVTVVGGIVDGRGQAFIGGELQIHRQVLYFHRDGERIVAETPEEEGTMRWWRWLSGGARRNYAGLTVTSAHTYNRVEGLPIMVGPTLVHSSGPLRARIDAFVIYRTSGGFDGAKDSASVGHLVKTELAFGRSRGIRVGARLYDEIAPVESWQLGDGEVGLATFFLHRDFRDYYGRHGGTAYASLHAGDDRTLTLSLGDQRWASRAARDPWTLFRNTASWRPNPQLDDARMHVANATVHIDTRNDEATPWAGWYLDADYEHGVGDVTTFGPVAADVSPVFSPVPLPGARDAKPGRHRYARGFLDARRYNRLSPDVQLNARLVLGGWLAGDPLPLERRLSVSGPGALPGFDFRKPTSSATDLGQCGLLGLQPSGSPAQCERMALAQLEMRGAVHLGLPFGDALWEHVAVHTAARWVVFADAGRGWLVGDAYRDLVYPASKFPPLSTFLSDVGAGIDFGSGGVADVASFGLYVAKSVSRPSQPANVFVRVRRRF
ncbi:hypothetical protein J421_2596 [Gemmatirosa kalamazoonensis]|uniref:Bacterial surface antigen (D15) domain-containing protein n=1 Tax=Gemmatirosa kalamazoonensis TaxID=861299 RepID=W0RL22_9BACT|nr:polymer-forming cytoskeletal protein [Gemmatirosa kalamazoonensis]AHG90133.1 hypothetical protein J421_2596 [Gemmatirosa kalamazoonensis]